MSSNASPWLESRLGGFNNPSRSRLIFLTFFGLLGITAAYLFWRYTPFGVGVGHDSLFYFSAAKNFASGRGLFWTGSGGVLKPLTHFPPFYPLILAGVFKIGLPIHLAAKLIAAFLFGLNITLFGWVLYTFTQRMLISVIGMTFLLLSPIMAETHLKAMSEPVFFFATFASFAALAMHINQPRRLYFVLAVLFASIAYLSRYSGIAVLVVSAVSIIILGERSLKVKIRETLIFTGLASLPMLLWMIRNMILTGSTTNRAINIHLINSDTMRQLLDVIFYWFSPELHSHWLEVALLALLFISFSTIAWREIRRRSGSDCRAPYLSILLLFFSAVYVAFLLVSLSFFDASTRLSNRILSPLFLASMLLVMLIMGFASRRMWQTIVPALFIAFMVLGPLPYMLQQTDQLLTTVQGSGLGFTSRTWMDSQLIQWIEDLDTDATIVTNQAMAVNFLTDFPAYQIPERYDPVKLQARSGYDQEIESLNALLQKPDSYFILFLSSGDTSEDFKEPFDNLQLVFSTKDGRVYQSHEFIKDESFP